ncbi:hypothetical protein LTR56_025214 [Elasticomyces elasticus]|nr:hypothetical protein LTR22_027388 [Elasticomyces elasticus]KAK3617540.1 hypothetical protein LTR56_025214 [Elasticomyces elasticus]KAK4899863.1 hypothetical protein LTR49_027568 [Elasticomyces elasticus]
MASGNKNLKRSISKSASQPTPRKRQKAAATRSKSQSTLTPQSPNHTESPPPDQTPYASQQDTPSRAEPGTEPARATETIRAKDRVEFEVDWSLFSSFGHYQLRQRTKRNIGNHHISWIYQYGEEVEELQPDGTHRGRFWL